MTVNKQPGMPDNWAQMTREQKRQYRFDKYLSGDGVKFVSEQAKQAYRVRARRLVDAYNVQEPDRVPIQLPVGSLPYILYGIDMHTAMYDYEKAVQACNSFNEQYSEELEYFAGPFASPGKVLEILDYKLYVWPGHGLSLEAPGYQFVEGEYMTADEYDNLIRDPSDFWLRTYLPRIFGTFECFRMFRPVTDFIEIVGMQVAPLANPQVRESLQKMLDAGAELQRRNEATAEFAGKGPAMGFPAGLGSLCKAPFDIIGDTLRGTDGIMKDMYRRPEKLLKAIDVIADVTINSMLTSPAISRMLLVAFPLHKGADGWMSRKQFDALYWPSLRKVVNAFIEEGLMVTLFAEGSYDTRLEYVNEFPRGAVNWWFDQTDMSRAKKILGKDCCIQGNVPSSMIVTGEPADVREYCRKLIEVCGEGGGFILSAGCIAENPRLDNLRAMLAAIREYGVYRK
jgi:uroporphyrinogen-III decarboxylase